MINLERNRVEGVCYAMTEDGIELPVVDITHPAFAMEIDAEDMPVYLKKQASRMDHFGRLPAFVRKAISSRSVLMGGNSGKFMTGMTTYLNKLGPNNLGSSCVGPLDRKVAASLTSVAVRLRLRAVSRLMAQAIASWAPAKHGCPIHLINIGGGPSADSLNALILLHKEHPVLLSGRHAFIHILDLDEIGPKFAARALRALTSSGSPLEGVSASLDYVKYDWSDATSLAGILKGLDMSDTIAIGSSEGGLFEYGSDDDVIANLRAIRSFVPAGFAMVGTIFRDVEVTHIMHRTSQFSFKIRTLDALERLTSAAGWTVEHVVDDNRVYQVFRLGLAE